MKKELLSILKKYETHPDFLGDTIEDVNQVGGMDDTVLHIAARNNSLNDALVFLQNGALIDRSLYSKKASKLEILSFTILFFPCF